MPVGQMTQNSEKVCHSAYRKSVGKMLRRQNARRQNEMSPLKMKRMVVMVKQVPAEVT
jgi:hypothetical protein